MKTALCLVVLAGLFVQNTHTGSEIKKADHYLHIPIMSPEATKTHRLNLHRRDPITKKRFAYLFEESMLHNALYAVITAQLISKKSKTSKSKLIFLDAKTFFSTYCVCSSKAFADTHALHQTMGNAISAYARTKKISAKTAIVNLHIFKSDGAPIEEFGCGIPSQSKDQSILTALARFVFAGVDEGLKTAIVLSGLASEIDYVQERRKKSEQDFEYLKKICAQRKILTIDAN